VLVLGNSNARGLSKGLCDRGVDGSAFVYPGQTVDFINDRVEEIARSFSTDQPDATVVHVADIEVRNQSIPISDICSGLEKLVESIRTRFTYTRIVLSSLPYSADRYDKLLNSRITKLNSAMSRLCANAQNMVYLCNKSARLERDNIHMTVRSRDFIARTVACHVKQCL
jgi:hypothetical protein